MKLPPKPDAMLIGSILQSPGEPFPATLRALLEYAPDGFTGDVGTIAAATRRACTNGVTPHLKAVAAELPRHLLPRLSELHSDAGCGLPLALAEIEAEKILPAIRKRALKGATPKPVAPESQETDDELLARMAGLPLLEYEREREQAAERLGCRSSILDRLVDARRPKLGVGSDGELQGSAVKLSDAEPWPDSVNGAEALNEVADSFSRYVVLPDGAADTLALWCAHAFAFDSFVCSPRLNVTSPEKQCGKTTLRDVIAALVPRPLPTENLTVAVLFRLVQAQRPTILADECDAWLRDNEEMRGLLNAGHKRGGQFLRCEGDSHEIRAFRVFAPAVLCGIGSLPGTLHDRSIIIRLERAKPDEVRARFDSRHTEREQELCRKLARWCADHSERLAVCDPPLPAGVFNRQADNWRPLFAVAELAGGDWPRRAAVAFAQLTSRDDTDAHGIGVMLLEDVRVAFTETRAVRIFSKRLVETLCAMTDRPWPEAHRGKPITETWLARRLKQFGIPSRTLRIGDERAKGYEAVDFIEAFDRYLPEGGFPSVTP